MDLVCLRDRKEAAVAEVIWSGRVEVVTEMASERERRVRLSRTG
jgi:hypothetical protein